MVKSMCHESFYCAGTWIDESIGVYVGWIARKDSFSEGMPLSNERGDVVLIFSGEEFSEPGISNRLKERGHELQARENSYLVHLYEEDSAFPACLNGRFHGLVIDRARRTVKLFNDRFGMHRIYYHEAKDNFYFAAEAKAILQVRPDLRKTDSRSVGELISSGCVLENRSLFEGINLLPPGSAWVFRNRCLAEKTAYFQPHEWENQETLESEAYYQELRRVFSHNLPRYFQGSEGIGMSLTGGLDTRVIMAWHKAPPESLPCYSFGGMFRESQDVQVARRVAEACGQSFSVIPVGEEFLSRFSHYAERTVYLSDGCASVRCSSDLYLNERAAEIAPVRMTGNYGGEVLQRLRAFKHVEPRANLFSPEMSASIRVASETYAKVVSGHPLSVSVFRQAPWHHFGLLGLEQTQISLRSPYLDNDLVRTVFRAPNADKIRRDNFNDKGDERVRLIADGAPALCKIRTDRGLAGNSGRLMTAASQGFLEFTFKAEYAFDYGMPQWLSRIDRRLSGLHLEHLFLGRHKFNHFRLWYRDALSRYVREILLDEQTLSRPYLDRRGVEAIVRGHLTGTGNFTAEIHQLLTLELIHRIFVD